MSIVSEFSKFTLLICILCIFNIYCGYQLKKVDIPTDLENVKIFTKEEIAKFDGSDPERPIYMAVKGVVFDVTSGKHFYGKGSDYNALVGKDATRGVAKMSLEPEDLVHHVSDLPENLWKSLDEIYEMTYVEKYPVVGYMDYLMEQHHTGRKTDL